MNFVLWFLFVAAVLALGVYLVRRFVCPRLLRFVATVAEKWKATALAQYEQTRYVRVELDGRTLVCASIADLDAMQRIRTGTIDPNGQIVVELGPLSTTPAKSGERIEVGDLDDKAGICPRDGKPCETAGDGSNCCGEGES